MSKILRNAKRTLWNEAGPCFLPGLTWWRVEFKRRVGYWPDLRAPRSFNEKILSYTLSCQESRLPVLAMLADKLAVREQVRLLMPELSFPRNYFVANSVDEIPFDSLPERCVIKLNFGGGGAQTIFYDQHEMQYAQLKQQCAKLLSWKPSRAGFLYKYGHKLSVRLFGEELLLDCDGRIPRDYKIHVFNGRAKFVLVVSGRWTACPSRTFFDADWAPLELKYQGFPTEPGIPKPSRLRDMLTIGEQLAKRLTGGLPFLRVDLYEIGDELYFGETDNSPGRGMSKFERDLDFKLGEELKLP